MPFTFTGAVIHLQDVLIHKLIKINKLWQCLYKVCIASIYTVATSFRCVLIT